MLNYFKKDIIYLDPDTLKYMYLNYSKTRNYPVMNKLYSILNEGYVNNLSVTPISFEHILPYIDEKNIESTFHNMMGSIGQVQFNQRFTIRTLQLIRVINNFFEQKYDKPNWRDVFSSNPDDKYFAGFNQYRSIDVKNVIKDAEREKSNSQIYFFMENFKKGKHIDVIVRDYFRNLCERYSDVIKPSLPIDGSYDYHMKKFLECKELGEIPEFHISSNILYQLFETYGMGDVERGLNDETLFAAETAAAYMPYCHFYVTVVDVAERIIKSRINKFYDVKVYENNESSLYKLIDDLTESMQKKKIEYSKKTSNIDSKKSRFL